MVGDRLQFEVLSQRIHPAASRITMLSEQTPASFVAFDLLALGDDDLTPRPFEQRRAALEQALTDAAAPVHLTPATRDPELAQQWFSQFEGAGLDGVVAKPLATWAAREGVVVMGFPFGIGPSASAGVVSGLQREFESPEGG